LDEAVENLRAVVAAYPNDQAAREYLASALAARARGK
jgi:hypothetical protein